MAQTIFIAGALRRGIPVYIMKKFDFVKMLENVQKFRISTLTMVPPIVVVRLSLAVFHSNPTINNNRP
jgi:4-coumarate--CoA ligase